MTLIEAMKADAQDIEKRYYKEFGQKRSFGDAPPVQSNGNRALIASVIHERGPIRTDEIRDATGLGNSCVNSHIRRLVKAGKVEKVGHAGNGGKGGSFAIYAIKEGEA